MIEAQVISKILEEKNLDILLDENINQFVKFIVSISMIIGLIGLFKNVFTNISDTNILL